ncbi:uncharacterized protein LOC117784487 [Drosophila innubila]|uniref:uncharacterized protein LOC117784487 n=1 Tax=Drosophila innubila TaxID=198719 RepID=UPI00148B4C52|nr:uncharacterized protein LOC117784487 [Drosophila innubila]
MSKMLRSWTFVLFAYFAFVESALIVPRINNENGFLLEPSNDGYVLSIRHPDGTSWREETVQEVSPGELEVKGTINQAFEDQGGTLVVIYEAGRNGYVAKYTYDGTGKPTPPPFQPFFLSAKSLMSAAG